MRGVDRLERRDRARVDLHHPRQRAVPDEVHAEHAAQAERGGQVRADRPGGVGQRVLLARRQPRRHDVPAPPPAAGAERAAPDQLLAHAEQRRGASVGDRRRGAREPGDALLHDDAAGRPAAAPLAHPAAAAAADRLAQPAAGAIRPLRRLPGGERARVREPRRAQARRRAPPDRARAGASAGCSRAACVPRQAGRRGRAGSRAPRRRPRCRPRIPSAASTSSAIPPRPPRSRMSDTLGHSRWRSRSPKRSTAKTSCPSRVASSASMRALTETSRITGARPAARRTGPPSPGRPSCPG